MKKKRKKRRRTFLLIIIFLLLGYLLYHFIFSEKANIFSSKEKYSTISQKVFEENNINIYDKEYSKTLDEVISSNNFNIIYIDEYMKINYIEDNDFINKVNKYLEIGYKSDVINNIFKLSNLNQNKLLELPKTDFNKYKDISNYNVENTDRYNSYASNNKELELEKVVTYVNIGLDKKGYEGAKKIEDPDSISVLVNKYHYLESDFVPKNLVPLFDTKLGYKMVDVAAEAYEKLILAAKEEGYTLESTTSYRWYSFQNTLYTNYVKKDGVEAADTYSARPGYSEHQTGLAVDLNDPNVNGSRLNDKDYEWLLNNSYKYGYIIRYPKDSQKITGYMEEPWHIRYLGIELATKVKESGLTYDEYYDIYIEEH